MKKIELTQTLISVLNDWMSKSQDAEKNEHIKNLINSSTEVKNEDLTKKNILILQWMKNNQDKNKNVFSAKQIGDGLFISGRAVSGSIKKLVILGYVNKSGKDPVLYSLTENGINIKLN